MREVLGIRAVEVESNMVIHVFYGIGDWELSGADCFMVVDCEVVAGASQMIEGVMIPSLWTFGGCLSIGG